MFAPRPDPASGEAWLGEGASTLVNWKFKHCKALGICKGLGYRTIGLGSNCKIQQLHHNPAHHVIIR
jgi:hypothetical protein